MWWIFKKLGFSYREPFELELWQNELLKEFPEDEWDINEWYSGKIKCVDYHKKFTNITLHMNDCSGMDVYINDEQVAEQEDEIHEVINIIKSALG